MPPTPLPIDDVLPELIRDLRRHSAVVLQAPTGAGKTTRVPPSLVDAGLASAGRVLMLEPRRLAARAAARRIAIERGGRVGDEIGYHVRFDRQLGRDSRIAVVTPGVMLRYLLDDPLLSTVSCVVFDEFHERGLDSDLALGLVRRLRQLVRPELRIVVMAATLDASRISEYLGGCPVIVSAGREHPVTILYEPKPPSEPWPPAAARAAERLLRRTDGDVLVFLPGMREIRATERELASVAERMDVAVLPLHGDLPAEQQDAALQPQTRRRIVLATNVAETSVTVGGITGVVDTGLARQLAFDPAVGLDRLDIVPIARSSADQRAGRAGRERPGVCVRLWSESQHRGRAEQTEPEIRRVDLAGAVLQLHALGETPVEQFPWLDPPPAATIAQSSMLLHRLGALRENRITNLGRAMAQLPAHPRLARLLIESRRLGCERVAATAAAMLSERSPFQRPAARPAFGRKAPSPSDVLDAVEAIHEFEQSGQTTSVCGELHRGAARAILRARDQLLRLIAECEMPIADSAACPGGQGEALGRAILAAFPDRVVRRRNPGGDKGVMVGGRGVRLAPTSAVIDGELFLAIDVDAGETESLVRWAARIERDWLPADQLAETIDVLFDARSERVVARRRLRYDDLPLEDREAPLPDDARAEPVFLAALRERRESLRPAGDSPAGQFLIRLGNLRAWMPELNLPAWTDEDLLRFMAEASVGRWSIKELRHFDWLAAVQSRLTFAQRQLIEREAPERIVVPSGSKLALHYEVGRPPVLAVRIQELFGLSATPRIAAGRVAVLLHLLAPNGRPQQVTDDLASFWANTYSQVRKDLRGRYPKHAWPENPLAAAPTTRTKKRS